MLNGMIVAWPATGAGVILGFLVWLITNSISLAVIFGLLAMIGVSVWVFRWMKEPPKKP